MLTIITFIICVASLAFCFYVVKLVYKYTKQTGELRIQYWLFIGYAIIYFILSLLMIYDIVGMLIRINDIGRLFNHEYLYITDCLVIGLSISSSLIALTMLALVKYRKAEYYEIDMTSPDGVVNPFNVNMALSEKVINKIVRYVATPIGYFIAMLSFSIAYVLFLYSDPIEPAILTNEDLQKVLSTNIDFPKFKVKDFSSQRHADDLYIYETIEMTETNIEFFSSLDSLCKANPLVEEGIDEKGWEKDGNDYIYREFDGVDFFEVKFQKWSPKVLIKYGNI